MDPYIISHLKVKLKIKRPLFLTEVMCGHTGFPSPAEDFIEKYLDPSEFLMEHPEATYFLTASGDSMIDAGIFDGDILVVDKSLTPKNNNIVIGCIRGEFICKHLVKSKNGIFLVSANIKYKPIKILPDTEFEVWGVVTFVISKKR